MYITRINVKNVEKIEKKLPCSRFIKKKIVESDTIKKLIKIKNIFNPDTYNFRKAGCQ